MIWFILIIIILLLIYFSTQKSTNNMRLLEFGKDDIRWVTMKEYNKLLKESKCIHPGFLDITDLIEPEQSFYNIARERADDYIMSRAVPKTPSQQSLITPLLKFMDKNFVISIIKDLSNFKNRFYTSKTGIEASSYIYNRLQSIASNDNKSNIPIKVDYFNHTYKPSVAISQKSVIASIQGKEIPEEIVIYCAHMDTLNIKDRENKNDSRAPGADDNASGVSNVIQAFKIMVSQNIQPKRTVEFHLYAAEEPGLKGSLQIAETYKQQGKKVIAVINNDMTGYSEDGKTAYIINGKDDLTDPELVDWCKQLVPIYTKLELQNGGCGYSCTDNFSWTRYGYPACGVSEASPQKGKLNPYVHTENDTFDKLNIDYSLEHGKLALAFIIEIAMM